jgi:hypothetical protein
MYGASKELKINTQDFMYLCSGFTLEQSLCVYKTRNKFLLVVLVEEGHARLRHQFGGEETLHKVLQHFKTLLFSVSQGRVRGEIIFSLLLEMLLCPTHGKSANILHLFDIVLVTLNGSVRIFVQHSRTQGVYPDLSLWSNNIEQQQKPTDRLDEHVEQGSLLL